MLPIKLLAKGVTGAYGLAKEAMAGHEATKANGHPHLSVPSHGKDVDGSSDDASSVSSSDGEDAAQELDEAQQHYATGEKETVLENAQNIDEVFGIVMKRQDPPKYSPTAGKLELPVILPQRRPKNKERGFVRAYAPILQTCGVGQADFLHFLDGFGKAIQVNTHSRKKFQGPKLTVKPQLAASGLSRFQPGMRGSGNCY